MLSNKTYRDFNDILFTENMENAQKMREGYFESMGNYLSAYLEWSKDNGLNVIDNKELKEEDKENFEQLFLTSWLFGMDLYTAVCTANNKQIDFSKFATPSNEKIDLYMQDENLKEGALNKYDIQPCVSFFINAFLMPNINENLTFILEYSYRTVMTLKHILELVIKDTFLLCYLQFER
jgi:hypothetical protein